MKKNSIILYFEQYEAIKDLSHEEKGILLDAIFSYAINGNPSEDLPPMVKMAFSFFKTTLDIDFKKYVLKCENNSKAVKKRWNNVNIDTNVYNRIQPNTNYTDTETDTETDAESSWHQNQRNIKVRWREIA